jgi:hypothetical protein
MATLLVKYIDQGWPRQPAYFKPIDALGEVQKSIDVEWYKIDNSEIINDLEAANRVIKQKHYELWHK